MISVTLHLRILQLVLTFPVQLSSQTRSPIKSHRMSKFWCHTEPLNGTECFVQSSILVFVHTAQLAASLAKALNSRLQFSSLAMALSLKMGRWLQAVKMVESHLSRSRVKFWAWNFSNEKGRFQDKITLNPKEELKSIAHSGPLLELPILFLKKTAVGVYLLLLFCFVPEDCFLAW